MENYHMLIKQAKRAFETADHLAYVTYPLIKETKLIITITGHLDNAVRDAVQALFEYERMYKRISYIPNEFMTRMEMMKTSILPRYGMQEYINTMTELRKIMEDHKKSSMEFVRNDKIFIYADGYRRYSSVSLDNVKGLIGKTRKLVDRVEGILART